MRGDSWCLSSSSTNAALRRHEEWDLWRQRWKEFGKEEMTYIPPKVIPERREEEKWVIELSKYERDNLLWLLLAVWGWGYGVEPFGLASTGDWVGMIPWKLMRAEGEYPQLTADDRPNCTHDELRQRIDDWLKRKIQEAAK